MNKRIARWGTTIVLLAVGCWFIVPGSGRFPGAEWTRVVRKISPFSGVSGVCIGNPSDIYLAGSLSGSDLNPGWGVDWRLARHAAFLLKLNTDGQYEWARTWSALYALAPLVDGSGEIYVAGEFEGTVDFDPGSGSREISAISRSDWYLSKFSPSGELLWVRSWNGKGLTMRGIATNPMGSLFAIGNADNRADLDPGQGEFWVDDYQSFVMELNEQGEFQWAQAWANDPSVRGVTGLACDAGGGVYVAGKTRRYGTTSPADGNTLQGEGDLVYLARYSGTGEPVWVRNWLSEYRSNFPVTICATLGDVFVFGDFVGKLVVDAGTPKWEEPSVGGSDLFLIRANERGEVAWVRVFGGPMDDYPGCVVADGVGSLYLCGSFRGCADFDPGQSETLRCVGNGEPIIPGSDRGRASDRFFCEYSVDGEFLGVQTGPVGNTPFEVACDRRGNVYAVCLGWASDSISRYPFGNIP